jgi:hypothetical protein
MTRSRRKKLQKTLPLFLKLTLLILLFWGGIQPVFTDLFAEDPTEKVKQISDSKNKGRVPADTLNNKISALHRFAN